MNNYKATRIPVDGEYAALLGKAVYVFAYYEWTIIWIIEFLEPGFVKEYSRETIMTSGTVERRFERAIDNTNVILDDATKDELRDCLSNFSDLVTKRNALIHAHPVTDSDGSQILSYQTKPTRSLPDMKWPSSEVQKIISEIDEVAPEASAIMDKLRE